MFSRKPNSAQQQFVRQYFKPLPNDPDEYERDANERWAAREDLIKAHARWATENQLDAERARKVLKFLAHMYDKFVHGAYLTSMELYDPGKEAFLLRGHSAPEKREIYKRAVSSKLHTALTALCCAADLQQMARLAKAVGKAACELYSSGELS